MKAGESIEVAGGLVVFGRELMLRAELVQSVSVEPASEVNRPVTQAAGRTVLTDEAEWFQLEVKYAPRSAPYVVFVGTEKECRCKLGRLYRELRGSGL